MKDKQMFLKEQKKARELLDIMVKRSVDRFGTIIKGYYMSVKIRKMQNKENDIVRK